MLNKFITLPVLLALYAVSLSVHAESDEQLGSISHLGKLNGVALQCKYLDDTRRMKKALVEAVPKKRHLGQLFDDKTNESFLAFIQKGSACPPKSKFMQQVDSAIASLNSQYPQ